MKRLHDLQWLTTKFRQFNNQIFANRLPEVNISLSSATKTLGKCQCRTDSSGKKVFSLVFTSAVALEDSVREDVVIHEMIHLMIGWNGLVDNAPHGRLFKAVMDSINAAHGRHISVTVRSDSTEVVGTAAKKARAPIRLIIVLRFRDGSVGIKSLPRVRESIAGYLKAVSQMTDVATVSLYFTDNPFFHRFPVSAALRYHRVDPTALISALKNAKAVNAKDIV